MTILLILLRTFALFFSFLSRHRQPPIAANNNNNTNKDNTTTRTATFIVRRHSLCASFKLTICHIAQASGGRFKPTSHLTDCSAVLLLPLVSSEAVKQPAPIFRSQLCLAPHIYLSDLCTCFPFGLRAKRNRAPAWHRLLPRCHCRRCRCREENQLIILIIILENFPAEPNWQLESSSS